MDDTVKNINPLLKNVQLELNFDKQQEQAPEGAQPIPSDPSVTRGSKRFIEQMNAELKEEQQPLTETEMFIDEEKNQE